MDLLLFSSVSHQIFYNLPIHQRFPSEEVNFQVATVSGICDQEIQCLLTHFKAHKCTSSVVLSLFCEAIFTGKVTVMCNVQAQCFYDRFPLLHLFNHAFVCIFYK